MKLKPILITYDISDNLLRSRLYKRLKAKGLCPYQKSCFWGKVNKKQYGAILKVLEEIKALMAPQDTVFLLPFYHENLEKAIFIGDFSEKMDSLEEVLFYFV